MPDQAASTLVHNALVLLVLGVAFDLAAPSRVETTRLRRVAAGLVVGALTIGLMLIPFDVVPGVFFDARSVALSVCGLAFGGIPTAVAMAMAAAHRISVGGPGMWTGVLSIAAAGLLGLAWRRWRPLASLPRPVDLLGFGLVVSAVTVLCMLTMPWSLAARALEQAALPMLGVLPLATLLLGSILDRKEERARVQQRLVESEQRFRRLAENAPDLIYRFRLLPAPGFEYVSPAALALTGYSPEEHYANPNLGYEVVHPEDRPKLQALMESGAGFAEPIRLRWVKKDGSVAWTEQRNVPIYDDAGALVAIEGVARDVTVQTTAEADRALMQAQLLHAQKMEAIGRLAGGVAHDFNNMLSVILAGAELARGDLPEDHPVRADLDDVLDAGRRSAALTRQLLAFSRTEAPERQRLDLNAAIGDGRKMLGRLIGEDISIHLDLAEGLWPVRMDPSHLDQILANLAVNARDAIRGHGAVRIATRNAVLDPAPGSAATAPSDHVELVVEDTGQGMDAETLSRVFEPFFTTKQPGKGTGLGLSTVYGIVHTYGGRVHVDSAPGRGTRFVLCFPRDHEAETSAPADPRGAARGRERVLVVEDEPSICRTTSRMLEQLGYAVQSRTDPHDAMELLRREPVDLVLSDIVMPKMSGLELRDALGLRAPPFLFMTGYAAHVIAERGLEAESLAIVHKPFALDTLAAAIRSALGRGSAEGAVQGPVGPGDGVEREKGGALERGAR